MIGADRQTVKDLLELISIAVEKLPEIGRRCIEILVCRSNQIEAHPIDAFAGIVIDVPPVRSDKGYGRSKSSLGHRGLIPGSS